MYVKPASVTMVTLYYVHVGRHVYKLLGGGGVLSRVYGPLSTQQTRDNQPMLV